MTQKHACMAACNTRLSLLIDLGPRQRCRLLAVFHLDRAALAWKEGISPIWIAYKCYRQPWLAHHVSNRIRSPYHYRRTLFHGNAPTLQEVRFVVWHQDRHGTTDGWMRFTQPDEQTKFGSESGGCCSGSTQLTLTRARTVSYPPAFQMPHLSALSPHVASGTSSSSEVATLQASIPLAQLSRFECGKATCDKPAGRPIARKGNSDADGTKGDDAESMGRDMDWTAKKELAGIWCVG